MMSLSERLTHRARVTEYGNETDINLIAEAAALIGEFRDVVLAARPYVQHMRSAEPTAADAIAAKMDAVLARETK